MYVIVNFCKLTFGVPTDFETFSLINFKTLVVFYDIKFEFWRNPGGKFKCNVSVCKGSAISSCL